ncbi:MAG: sigma-54 dependent transcriptional regulator [Deltaproteobacteria bacterium]|nr:sigma-54 dependent transcriptional regulator [Deltaproteobacteria bacterium]
MANILLIEKHQKWQDIAKKALEPAHRFCSASPAKALSSRLREENYDIILFSLFLVPKTESLNLLEKIRLFSPYTPVIVISENSGTSFIVEIVKKGAFDFMAAPFSKEEMLFSIEHALEKRQLKNEIDYLRREQDILYDFDSIIAKSPAMKKTMIALKKFSRVDSTILLTGETGTGKSFLSGAVHFNSTRHKRPFIKINCANIPEALLESELFGHEKGAFTGANKTRMGRLEQGHGGTVFLDEIGEMKKGLQAKLLRVLEEKSFERVGGNKTIHSDVRIICATNRNPEKQVEEGKFREDLYYRINVLRVHLPPLRERTECIEPLADFLLAKCCRNLKKNIKGFSPLVIEVFKTYSWPGNIRELTNAIERAVILEESPLIQIESTTLQAPPHQESSNNTTSNHFASSIDEQKKGIILKALEENHWVQKAAAESLNVSPRVLNYQIRKFGITHAQWRKNK